MNKKDHIKQQVKEVLNATDSIKPVKASPFFKEKVLHRLFDKKEEELPTMFAWFTPKLQLATLLVVVAVNLVVFLSMDTTDITETHTEFAEAYELSPNSEVTIFD